MTSRALFKLPAWFWRSQSQIYENHRNQKQPPQQPSEPVSLRVRALDHKLNVFFFSNKNSRNLKLAEHIFYFRKVQSHQPVLSSELVCRPSVCMGGEARPQHWEQHRNWPLSRAGKWGDEGWADLVTKESLRLPWRTAGQRRPGLINSYWAPFERCYSPCWYCTK